ncbi:sulfotransferase family protein [Streptomyces sp. SID7909]|uniref:sulfotransferase-like domain-containing protein n=1 Tax=Streptomyces sp. SID7909 TaxID=2706092 RepID=UPI0013BB8611|nr:sulfotransferase family protein [Streptomyces sp. SID7909]NEC09499.1 sulfotransferase family protein [Streptomyces sp. SID7909]
MHESIALWSHPRSVSTALERCFMERGDFKVFHEALAYVYFVHEERAAIPHKNPDPDHPRTYADVKNMMEQARTTRPVFHKDFPYHAIDHLVGDPDYLRGQTNTFLIRDPAEAVLSHASVHPELTREVLGYEQLARLFDFVRELTGTTPVVINARDLAASPAATINAYCDAVGIPFLPGALSWDSGERPEWTTWSGWHTDVADSSGFRPPARKYRFSYETRPELREFVDHCRPFYAHLDQFCISPAKESVI